jgi:hypothetical protein
VIKEEVTKSAAKEEVSKAAKAEAELADKISVIKERGNLHFKKKAYKEAIKQFSEGISLFQNAGKPIENEDIKTKIT